MPKTCVYCQRELPPGARRCGYCGNLQPPDTLRPRRDQPREAAPPDRRALLIKVLIAALVVALIGLGGATALVIAQSGSPHQQQALAPTATRAGHPGPTTTPAPSATATAPGPTATGQPTTSCGAASNTPLTIKNLNVVDFAPTLLLPDTMPLKPTLVSQVQTGTAITPGASVLMSVGLILPTAPQVAAVCQVSVKLIAFQALASTVPNVRILCDAYYSNPGGPVGGGCGGGAPDDGQANITFSSTQVGTTIVAPLTGGPNPQQPVQITASSNGVLDITIQVATPGTYTFGVGLWQDSSGPQWSNLTLQRMILLGHITNYWGGQACAAASMQSQLPPPTNPPGQFICPGGPPQ